MRRRTWYRKILGKALYINDLRKINLAFWSRKCYNIHIFRRTEPTILDGSISKTSTPLIGDKCLRFWRLMMGERLVVRSSTNETFPPTFTSNKGQNND